MNKAMLLWLNYHQALLASEGLDIPRVRVSLVSSLLQVSSARINECSTDSCFDDERAQLEQRLSRQLGYYSPLADWCEQSRVEAGQRELNCLSSAEQTKRNIIKTRQMTLARQSGLERPFATKLEYDA